MSTNSSKYALVVGGSGMLADFCRELAKHCTKVGVVGRTKAKMQSFSKMGNIVPIYVDYTNLKALEIALEKFVKDFGRPSRVVAWVHSTAPDAVLLAARYCDDDFYEITGHSGSEQDHESRQHEKFITELGISYHRIILGRMGDRWLTNSEISNGVSEALGSSNSEYLVGQL